MPEHATPGPYWKARLRGKTFIVSHIHEANHAETVLRGGLSQEVATFAASVANDAIDEHKAVVEAARLLLDRIDGITTDEFQLGGEREQREALRRALARLGEVSK